MLDGKSVGQGGKAQVGCDHPCLICFASQDGQARRIAATIGEALTACGIPVRLSDLMKPELADEDLVTAPIVVVVAAIRYGKHLMPARQFMLEHLQALNPERLAVISVNLTARKPGKTTRERNVYLRKWLASLDLKPRFAEAVAGRLVYARYTLLEKAMLRFVLLVSDGLNAPKGDCEYTDWGRVKAIGTELASLLRQTPDETSDTFEL